MHFNLFYKLFMNDMISNVFLTPFLNYIYYIIIIPISFIKEVFKQKKFRPTIERPEYYYDYTYVNTLTIFCLILCYSTIESQIARNHGQVPP